MNDLEKALEPVVERVLRRLLADRDIGPAADASKEYLSTKEAAELARVSVYTIRRWVKHGELTRHLAGTRVLVRRDELEALLACEVVPIDSKVSIEEQVRRRFG